jgi:glycosyltransferase involved in cell wall biosynthesis
LFKKRLFEYFFNTFVDFCTANSSYTRKRVIESYNINSEKIVVVHNGIELDFMSNVSLRKSKGGKLENNSDTYIVGTVCRFDSLKRIDRLLAAFAHFISQYKLKAKLFLIGDGPVRSSLENFAKDLGVDRYTVFTGYQENVSIWLRNLNVFVLPSEGEAFGLALVEAMLAQKPVIVFADSGGLLELVKDGKTGFIAKNEKQLADILFTLYQNPGLRAKIGKEAAGIVKREFSIEAMNRKLKKVYLEVAKCQA